VILRRSCLLPILVGLLLATTSCSGRASGPAAHGDEEVANGAADDPVVDLSELSMEFGCDEWFKVANETRTVGLVLRAVSIDPAELRAESRLPSDRWIGEIWVGEDLFATNCGDVFDVDDPVPRIDEVWPVTEAELTVVRLPLREVGGPAAVELRGVVVSGPDGSRIELGDIAIRNPSFWISGGA
jgi:hypothetical protein